MASKTSPFFSSLISIIVASFIFYVEGSSTKKLSISSTLFNYSSLQNDITINCTHYNDSRGQNNIAITTTHCSDSRQQNHPNISRCDCNDSIAESIYNNHSTNGINTDMDLIHSSTELINSTEVNARNRRQIYNSEDIKHLNNSYTDMGSINSTTELINTTKFNANASSRGQMNHSRNSDYVDQAIENNPYVWLSSSPSDSHYGTYTMVINSIEKMFTSSQLWYLSCKDKCGRYSGNVCSCSPLCYHYKTCCYDYADECAGKDNDNRNTVINQLQENSWIEDISLKCLNNILMVTSCRPLSSKFEKQKIKVKRSSARLVHSSSTNPFSGNLSNQSDNLETLRSKLRNNENNNKNISEGYSTMEISASEYLNLISLEIREGRLSMDSLTEFETALLSWPIRDSKAGIIYDNKTIYDCNQADDQYMTLMDLGMQISPADVTDGQTLISVDVLFKHAVSDSRFFYRPAVTDLMPGGTGNVPIEPCIPVMVSECLMETESFDNILIRESCERVSMPVNVTYSLNHTFRETKTYKNIFCFVCSRPVTRFSKFYSMKALNPLRHTYVFFQFRNGSAFVRTIHNQKERSTWSQVSCHFYATRPWPDALLSRINRVKKISTNTNINITDTNDIRSEADSRMSGYTFTNVCGETECVVRGIQPPCYEKQFLYILLPPANRTFSLSELESYSQLLIKALDQIIDHQVKPASPFLAVKKKDTKNGMTFAYEVSIVYRLTYVQTQLDLKVAVGQALVHIRYPFKRDNYQLCWTFQRYAFASRIYSCHRMSGTDVMDAMMDENYVTNGLDNTNSQPLSSVSDFVVTLWALVCFFLCPNLNHCTMI